MAITEHHGHLSLEAANKLAEALSADPDFMYIFKNVRYKHLLLKDTLEQHFTGLSTSPVESFVQSEIFLDHITVRRPEALKDSDFIKLSKTLTAFYFMMACLDVCISKDFSALGVVSIKSFDFDYIENAVTLVFTNDKHVEVSLNTYYTYVDPTKSIFDQDDCLVVIQSNSKPTFGDYFEANDKYYKNICLRDFSKNFISELYNFVF